MITTKIIFIRESNTESGLIKRKLYRREEIENPLITFWEALRKVYIHGEQIKLFERTKDYVNANGERVIIKQRHTLGSGLEVTVTIFCKSVIPKKQFKKLFTRKELVAIVCNIYDSDMSILEDRIMW